MAGGDHGSWRKVLGMAPKDRIEEARQVPAAAVVAATLAAAED